MVQLYADTGEEEDKEHEQLARKLGQDLHCGFVCKEFGWRIREHTFFTVVYRLL